MFDVIICNIFFICIDVFLQSLPSQFYGSELEGYVYYKSLRDYRMVEDSTHCPPWCVNIMATGKTKLETLLICVLILTNV